MKKILLLIFPFAFSIGLKAQPTLTAANSNPLLGEVTTNKNGTYIAPGPGGAEFRPRQDVHRWVPRGRVQRSRARQTGR